MPDLYEWRIEQDGAIVASGSCPSEERMRAEVYHHALIYAKEGAVTGERRINKLRWDTVVIF